MNSAGAMSPRSGCCQRTSASAPTQRASDEADDRLEEEPELAALERAVQRVLGRVRGDGAGAHRVVEHLDAAAARLLGVVHRGVGVAEQLLRALVARRRQRDADARADEHLGAAHDHRPDDGREQPLGDLDRLLARGLVGQVFAEDRELVAAEAGDGVAGPDHRLELARDRDQQLVAGVVAEAVVDVLEAVEVEEQRRRRSTSCAGSARSPGRAGRGTAGGSAGR